MKQEDIIRMAREAGWQEDMFGFGIWDSKELSVFAALVAAAATEAANARATSSWTLMCKKMLAFENEACAKVADECAAKMTEMAAWGAKQCAAAIRARGQA